MLWICKPRIIGQALACPRCPALMESSTALKCELLARWLEFPRAFKERYGIFTTTRSFGCVSVPNGEPAIGESNPVEALVEALMVKTEMSPPTLLVTSRNFPDGSITTLEGALFAVKGEPVIGVKTPLAASILKAEIVLSRKLAMKRNLPSGVTASP